jgi:hypothetical protein
MNLTNQPEASRKQKKGFIAFWPKWLRQRGSSLPPRATSAAGSALGLRPRRALSSAQPRLQWTTATSPSNDSSSNGDKPLNLVSHDRGSLHLPSVSLSWYALRENSRHVVRREGAGNILFKASKLHGLQILPERRL